MSLKTSDLNNCAGVWEGLHGCRVGFTRGSGAWGRLLCVEGDAQGSEPEDLAGLELSPAPARGCDHRQVAHFL